MSEEFMIGFSLFGFILVGLFCLFGYLNSGYTGIEDSYPYRKEEPDDEGGDKMKNESKRGGLRDKIEIMAVYIKGGEDMQKIDSITANGLRMFLDDLEKCSENLIDINSPAQIPEKVKCGAKGDKMKNESKRGGLRDEIENWELCTEHDWGEPKTVEFNQGMCACARHTRKVTQCKKCGTDKDMYEKMIRQLQMDKVASTVLPKGRIGG
jgi:hypothetical protein